jgi:peroxiredoxin Q/BCP
MLRKMIQRLTGGKGEEAHMLPVGSDAPDFSVRAHDGTTVKLAALRGRKVILWFYPKADTPG